MGLTVERLFRVNIGATLRASVEPYFALSVGPSGLLYIADTTADRVLVYDTNGQNVNRWGSTGTGPGQFRFAAGDATIGGIAVDGAGDVYVADSGNDRIQRFDSGGRFELQWGTPGTENGQFTRTLDTAVDRQGNVYVLEDRNSRVQKFSSSGTFLLRFAEGAFEDPGGIEVDSTGNVYVADYRGHVVKKFDAAGSLVATWGRIGRAGGEFDQPSGIAVDAQDAVYVADSRNRRIQKLRADGSVVGHWYTGNVQTAFVVGVAVDAQGFVYTIDIRGILQKFRVSQ